mmetsp:Transcript_14515/g.23711  ORF Transcript_14515/g.23711 Transcript_14515/m.23711 type:complete len:178 (-) Transcript_14515:1120-1653(-)
MQGKITTSLKYQPKIIILKLLGYQQNNSKIQYPPGLSDTPPLVCNTSSLALAERNLIGTTHARRIFNILASSTDRTHSFGLASIITPMPILPVQPTPDRPAGVVCHSRVFPSPKDSCLSMLHGNYLLQTDQRIAIFVKMFRPTECSADQGKKSRLLGYIQDSGISVPRPRVAGEDAR